VCQKGVRESTVALGTEKGDRIYANITDVPVRSAQSLYCRRVKVRSEQVGGMSFER